MAIAQKGYSHRTVALIALLTIGIITGFLIYIEQVALLYVFATLAIVALLVAVGRADLAKADREDAGLAVKE